MPYLVDYGSSFKKNYKKIKKQGKDLNKLYLIINKLANKEQLDVKYCNHILNNNKIYYDCYECHIEPNWLLIYKYDDNHKKLILYATGSHNELFKDKY